MTPLLSRLPASRGRGLRAARPLLALLLALSLLGCVTARPQRRTQPHPQLAPLWRDYAALADWRALAVAGNIRSNRWVAGAAAGHEVREEAEAEALAECRRRRAERRFQDECLLYAVGSEIVWTGP